MEMLNLSEKLNQRPGEAQAFTLVRKMATAEITKNGWPSKKQEAWKYSPVSKLHQDFEAITNWPTSSLNIDQLKQKWSHADFNTIVSINGHIPMLPTELQDQLEIIPLKLALQQGHISLEQLGATPAGLQNTTTALNLAFFETGYYLRIKPQVTIQRPIHFLHVMDLQIPAPLINSQLVIEAKQSSSTSFIESFVYNSEHKQTWLNNRTRIRLEDKAHFHYIHWNQLGRTQQQTSRIEVELGNECFWHGLHGSLTSGWTRQELDIIAQGENSEIVAHGLGFSRGNGHADQHTKISFIEPSNKSEQICKNLLVDSSRAVFDGTIHIAQKAQKTDCSQLHQSLLLSSEAEVDTKPELEIYADDVKATHGATVGQLNSDELFYFQSRGISKTRAQEILCQAFLLDLCVRFPERAIQGFLQTQLENFWKRDSI